MTGSTFRRGLAVAATIALIAALPASAAIIKEHRTIRSGNLEVRNLIGEVHVEGHEGAAFEVDITIQGADANEGLVTIEENGDVLSIVFPRQGDFVYPRLGPGSRTSFSFNDGDSSWLGEILGDLFRRGRIEVRGSGKGLEVWADLTIRVPHGSDLVVRHGVGQLDASGVEGNVDLRIRSGHAGAERIDGNLVVDTGSGHVNVQDVRGNVSIDTGSGHVEASGLAGSLVNIDTGSGHVDLDDVRTEELRIDTGSGRVEARRISTDSADIDTGSGGVTLELDHMGEGNYRIDTGSGGITMRLPSDASADFKAETGSGGIHVDLEEGVKLRRMERNEASFSVGGGGARVVLDTGSGGIRITR